MNNPEPEVLTPSGVVCPISERRLNEKAVRFVAVIVVTLAVLTTVLGNYFISAFLMLDFFQRGFLHGKYSILRNSAEAILSALNVERDEIDAAPKEFAAKIAFIFALTIFAGQVAGMPMLSMVAGSILVFCALLESVIGFCLGCYFYTLWLKLPFNQAS